MSVLFTTLCPELSMVHAALGEHRSVHRGDPKEDGGKTGNTMCLAT